MILLPVVGLPCLLTLVARQRATAFRAASFTVVLGLVIFATLTPSLTVYYQDLKWAAGYETWVFPVAAAHSSDSCGLASSSAPGAGCSAMLCSHFGCLAISRVLAGVSAASNSFKPKPLHGLA